MSGTNPDKDKKEEDPSMGLSNLTPAAPVTGVSGKNAAVTEKGACSTPQEESVNTPPPGTVEDAPKQGVSQSVSWADIMEAEDIDEQTRKKIEAVKSSLLSVIRGKIALSTESRILVPGNMKDELPKYFERFALAAKLVKCELVEDPSVTLTVARKIVFGDDVHARDTLLQTLYDANGAPKAELVEISDFTALMESILELPDPTTMSAPLGRAGTFHTFALFMRTYCEQMYDTPIAKQKNWWKGGAQIREDMIKRVKNVVGTEVAAKCIMNAFDILYRKFVRAVLKGTNTDHKERLHAHATVLSKKMFVTGGGLYQNLLHVETRVKNVIVETAKSGKAKREVREEKYLAKIKPHVSDGPKTTLEQTVLSKINQVLAKTDTLAKSFDFESKLFTSPKEWEGKHKDWVESLYTRTQVASNEIVRRKKDIRSHINATRAENLKASGKEQAGTSATSSITPDEWRNAQSYVMAGIEGEWEQATLVALSTLFGSHRARLDEYLTEPEDELLMLLSPGWREPAPYLGLPPF